MFFYAFGVYLLERIITYVGPICPQRIFDATITTITQEFYDLNIIADFFGWRPLTMRRGSRFYVNA